MTVLVVIGILSSCTLTGGGRNENPNVNPNAKYYTGSEGVVAKFDNLPPRLYYYGPDDNAGNEFTVGVEVKNKGTSFTRGGIYLSGFDPYLFSFKEIPLQRDDTGACGISIGSIGFGEFGGIFRCDGVEVSGNSDRFSFSIDTSKFSADWWDNSEFGNVKIEYGKGPNGDTFSIKFPGSSIEYFQHGRLFIALLSSLDYTKNGGQEFMLAGDTYDFPGGQSSYITYNGKLLEWPPGSDQITQHLQMTTCYQYTTFADPMVCIDPDPNSDVRKVCTPKSKTWSGGNGAPVAITSIEQENTPRKIIFRINVKNIGRGTVYDPGKLEKCSPYYPGRVTPEDLNIVYLGDVRIGQTGLRTSAHGGMSCYPEVIRLDPNTKSGSVTCTYPIEFTQLKSAYETPLVVELWYGYSETEKRNIAVKRVT